MKKTLFKKGMVFGVVLATLGLSACSHHTNLLLEKDKTQSARFLVHASQFAEKRDSIKANSFGQGYGECMQGKLNEATCQPLYDAMLKYAKNKKVYPGLTKSDITAQHAYSILKEYYDREVFNVI